MHRRTFYYAMLALFCLSSCMKNNVIYSDHASDLFWVSNNGADMPVWVKGNTNSNIILLVIHGGPGEGAYDFSGTETKELQKRYAVAFWDQRDAGASSGTNNLSQLSLPSMVNDMDVVVKTLHYRYHNASLFILAHSFGGLLASAYLTKDRNQLQIKGFIDMDGAHNYPLCNSLSRQMLIDTGTNQINKGINVDQWSEILNYAKSNDPLTSYDVSSKTEQYAHSAEGLMGVKSSSSTSIFVPEDPISNLSNYYIQYFSKSGINFQKSLEHANYSDELNNLKSPTLLLWGQYDFTVPIGVAYDAVAHLSSSYKKIVLFPHSGHRPIQTEPEKVQSEISAFIEQFK
jgi:Predicted hydrolases or acyltransferases (alpha/beta hydrolase superfamily)